MSDAIERARNALVIAAEDPTNPLLCHYAVGLAKDALSLLDDESFARAMQDAQDEQAGFIQRLDDHGRKVAAELSAELGMNLTFDTTPIR